MLPHLMLTYTPRLNDPPIPLSLSLTSCSGASAVGSLCSGDLSWERRIAFRSIPHPVHLICECIVISILCGTLIRF